VSRSSWSCWLSQLTAGAPYASHVLVPLLLAGTGFGMSIVPLTMGATTGLPTSQAGLASGLIQTSRSPLPPSLC
jgi:hypothetical protein